MARIGDNVEAAGSDAQDTIVDLVPFLLVTDVERSIAFYEALGFAVVKRYEPGGRIEFAGLEATSSAKLMLARVDRVMAWDGDDPDASGPGWLYLYTPELDAFRERLIDRGIAPGEIEDGPGPGPNRQLCIRDPDGHRHMVSGLWPGSVARDPRG
jgi:catechol 2,3-dioxygenase-like lactoylglutathione lyase family enzyme